MKYHHFANRQFNVLETKRPKIDYDDSEDSELSDGEEPGYKWQSFFEKPQPERIKILEAAGVQIDKVVSEFAKLNRLAFSKKDYS